jgi:hypothetical protein
VGIYNQCFHLLHFLLESASVSEGYVIYCKGIFW